MTSSRRRPDRARGSVTATPSRRPAALPRSAPAEAFRDALAAYQKGELDRAGQLCRAILAVQPNHCDAIHLIGLVHYREGRLQEALAALDSAMDLAPRNAALLNNRGNVLKELRRLPQALAGYEAALAIRPHYPEALSNRGVVLCDLKRPDEALASFDSALALRSGDAETHNNRGLALKQLGRLAEALASFDQALAIRPDYPEALSNRGNALYDLKRFEAALASYDRLLAIAPRSADALNHRGNTLVALHRLADAVASYDLALKSAPDHVLAHCNRGIALAEAHQIEAALASFDRALALDGQHADAHQERGDALKALMRLGEAAESYRRALALDPDHAFALGGLADCALKLCDWDLQERIAGQVSRSAFEGKAPVAPLVLLGYSGEEALHLAGARRFAAHRFTVTPEPMCRSPRRHRDRIKVAYLSADFRQHPVGQLTAQLFERHDRRRFEIVGISFGPDDRSALRARIAAAFDRFVDVRTTADREAAGLMHDLQIDIAVDLAGYTKDMRPEILNHRPAPVAVNYLGFPGTTAAAFIDYIIADRIVLPPDSEAFHTEKVVRLPDSFMPGIAPSDVLPQPTAAARVAARAAAGLPPQGVVFCCFNNHAKITATMFALWMRLLRGCDDAVLWLSRAAEPAQANLRHAAAAQGVNPDRLVFAPRVEGFAEHLARHRLADLFLDTLPYNAHTTANDALWAGLPVLTCRGSSLSGRVAASLVFAAGLEDLVTSNLEEYEDLALRLARDRDELAALTSRLSRNRPTSPLFDAERYVRHLECAYVEMWRRCEGGEAPAGFDVARCAEVNFAGNL